MCLATTRNAIMNQHWPYCPVKVSPVRKLTVKYNARQNCIRPAINSAKRTSAGSGHHWLQYKIITCDL